MNTSMAVNEQGELVGALPLQNAINKSLSDMMIDAGITGIQSEISNKTTRNDWVGWKFDKFFDMIGGPEPVRPKGSCMAIVGPNTCINIWHYDDAPEAYKALSEYGGGDGDWIAFIPAGIDSLPLDIDENCLRHFSHIDRYGLEDGTVIISIHA